MSLKDLDKIILDYLSKHSLSSSKEIHEGSQLTIGYATTKRILQRLKSDNYVEIEGQGKATRYRISRTYRVIRQIDVDEYFTREIDEREIKDQYDFRLIPEVLREVKIFTEAETERLEELQDRYEQNIQGLSHQQYQKELERLAIDLSWKSSEIEGNTYSLLETERLLREQVQAAGRKKEEATMLLNHKAAIDFISNDPDYLSPLTVRGIEDIHSLLVKDLGVERNIRVGRVGISGTNYRPLDNEYQIREALQHMCDLVNFRKSIFEKSLFLLVLLSYIQAFNDGNKRTARIVSNACLMQNRYCPISFRTVDSIAYKKGMLIFYEQGNLSVFKNIFIEQFAFAVRTYF